MRRFGVEECQQWMLAFRRQSRQVGLVDNFNLKWHYGEVQKISMLEIRQNARGLVERLRRGESFTITYRNQPVGELRPVAEATGVREDDPVYRLGERAEDLGESLDARQADTLLYGE